MPPGIGYSFAPGSDDIPMQGGMSGGSASAPASAVKVLSMRVPKKAASAAIAPQALLQSPGSAGAPGGFDPMLLQLLMKAFAPPQSNGVPNTPSMSGTPSEAPRQMGRPTIGSMGSASAPLPPPRIIPGDVPMDPPGHDLQPFPGPPSPREEVQPGGPTLPPLFESSPWQLHGRNPRLAEKYSNDSFGHDIQPLF
jgi:hypothetical protein